MSSHRPDPDADPDADAGGAPEDPDLAFLARPAPAPPHGVIVSLRVTADERARIDRVAEAGGVSVSAYGRAWLFGEGPDVAGWRAVYALVREHDRALAAAAEGGDWAAVTAAVARLRAGFRDVALSVFPEGGRLSGT